MIVHIWFNSVITVGACTLLNLISLTSEQKPREQQRGQGSEEVIASGSLGING